MSPALNVAHEGTILLHHDLFGGNQMQKVEVRLEDDLTGGPADETVTFGADGKDYEIDLTAEHAASLRKQLAAFVDRARQVQRRAPRLGTRSAASRERSQAIRAWARQEGFEVAEHGRLPAELTREYDLAHSRPQRPDDQPGKRKGGRRRRSA